MPKANIEEYSHVPSVIIKTWFHTGVYLQEGKVAKHYQKEYYKQPGLSDQEFDDILLPDTVMPNISEQEQSLSPEEEREACRALKGSILRQEVYSLEGFPANMPLSHLSKLKTPYTISEYNYSIELIQTRNINRNCISFVHPRETIDYHHEQTPFDPRISHNIILNVDKFGNILGSATIGYARQNPDPRLSIEDQIKQGHPLCTCTESVFTNYIDQDSDELDDVYRTPLPYESSTYELTGLIQDNNNHALTHKRVDFDMLNDAISSAEILQDEEKPSGYPNIQKRLIEQVRTLYTKNDLSGQLPRGELQFRALPYESYKLAFTPGLIKDVYNDHDDRVTDSMLLDKKEGGGYLHFPPEDPNWWMPSGKVFYFLRPPDTSESDPLNFAKIHFFLPHRFEDSFDNTTKLWYDDYTLLLKESHDPVENVVSVVTEDEEGNPILAIDYRVLQPWIVTDPNGNRVAVAFDALGSVAFSTVMGKLEEPDGLPKGDTLPKELEVDLSVGEIEAFFDDPTATAPELLGSATSRFIYDVDSFYRSNNPEFQRPPVYTANITRDTHINDPNDNNDGFYYSSTNNSS